MNDRLKTGYDLIPPDTADKIWPKPNGAPTTYTASDIFRAEMGFGPEDLSALASPLPPQGGE